jgi:uncharacterized membrane protein YccF (DUF307 family)
MAVDWVIAAIVMAITVVVLPWTRAAFSIASYNCFPSTRRQCYEPNTLAAFSYYPSKQA